MQTTGSNSRDRRRRNGVLSFWFFALVLVSALCMAGCRSDHRFFRWFGKKDVSESLPAMDRASGLDMEMLNRTHLHMRWTSQVPLSQATEVVRLYTHQGQVYVLDSHNVLTALDSDKGTIAWSSILAPPKIPASKPFYFKGLIVWAFGGDIIQVRESDGKIISRLPLKYEFSTNIGRNEDRFFVGTTDRRFYSLRLSDGVPMWQDVFMGQPFGSVSVDQGQVYFVTQDRQLHVYTTKERKSLWTFKAHGDLVGVVVDGNQCFLPSSDTSLRCFDAQSGEQQWSYLSGGVLVDLPTVMSRYCYQPIQYKSLICLDRRDGSLKWELKDGRSFIAENGPATYVMTLNNEFALMNNTTGQREVSFYVPQVDLYAVNQEDPTCYLARNDGTIWALSPDKDYTVGIRPKQVVAPESKPAPEGEAPAGSEAVSP